MTKLPSLKLRTDTANQPMQCDLHTEASASQSTGKNSFTKGFCILSGTIKGRRRYPGDNARFKRLTKISSLN
ncbi:MAG TPA: hypothetical protein DIT58_04680 [Porticoccaceae bacterium]|nr:hypothetical protein [Porticoccaceae bacterium]